jgi:hypothetical protein
LDLKLRLDPRLVWGGSELARPYDHLATGTAALSKAKGDASRVHEKVKLASAEQSDPIKPLDTSGEASSIDGTWRKAVGRESEAATTGTPQGLLWDPGRCEEGGEVSLEYELEFNDSGGRVRDDKRASEIGDGVSNGDIDVGGSRRCHGERKCKCKREGESE